MTDGTIVLPSLFEISMAFPNVLVRVWGDWPNGGRRKEGRNGGLTSLSTA